MAEKNLFLYDLAVVAIFKDEARYLKEWLDYHLLAGIEHFYLYNNNSSDDFAEVLAPYVDAKLVTLTAWPGKLQMFPAYNDAIEKFRFDCRYMAFIDLDEFIFPKTNQSVAEVVDEIFAEYPNMAALGVNWQCFGSNRLEAADYTRGVLERFTRRAKTDWFSAGKDDSNEGNIYIKSIVNPRRVDYFSSPHFAICFADLKTINSRGEETYLAGSYPVAADKIVVNHYFTKSREEYARKKMPKGSVAVKENYYNLMMFDVYDRNDVFDDGILNYRAARAENFSLVNDADRLRRIKKSLVDTLTQRSPFDAPADFFVGKLETFMTCRAVAEKLGIKIGSRSAEEFALVWIYQTLGQASSLTHAEIQQFIRALPEILARPFDFCRKVKKLAQDVVIPSFCATLKESYGYAEYSDLHYIQKLLSLIK